MTNYFKHKFRSKSPAEIAGWVVLGIAFVVGCVILFGFIILWLWNALLPEIFGFPEITYWQAVGLFILFKIFFGGFGSSSSSKNSSKKKDKSGDGSKSDFSKWELYDKFWEEEGDAAYQAYIQRAQGNDPAIESHA